MKLKLEKEPQYVYVLNHRSGEYIVELELVEVLSDYEILTKAYNKPECFEVIQTQNIIEARKDAKINAIQSAKEYCALRRENKEYEKRIMENESLISILSNEVYEHKGKK